MRARESFLQCRLPAAASSPIVAVELSPLPLIVTPTSGKYWTLLSLILSLSLLDYSDNRLTFPGPLTLNFPLHPLIHWLPMQALARDSAGGTKAMLEPSSVVQLKDGQSARLYCISLNRKQDSTDNRFLSN